MAINVNSPTTQGGVTYSYVPLDQYQKDVQLQKQGNIAYQNPSSIESKLAANATNKQPQFKISGSLGGVGSNGISGGSNAISGGISGSNQSQKKNSRRQAPLNPNANLIKKTKTSDIIKNMNLSLLNTPTGPKKTVGNLQGNGQPTSISGGINAQAYSKINPLGTQTTSTTSPKQKYSVGYYNTTKGTVYIISDKNTGDIYAEGYGGKDKAQKQIENLNKQEKTRAEAQAAYNKANVQYSLATGISSVPASVQNAMLQPLLKKKQEEYSKSSEGMLITKTKPRTFWGGKSGVFGTIGGDFASIGRGVGNILAAGTPGQPYIENGKINYAKSGVTTNKKRSATYEVASGILNTAMVGSNLPFSTETILLNPQTSQRILYGTPQRKKDTRMAIGTGVVVGASVIPGVGEAIGSAMPYLLGYNTYKTIKNPSARNVASLIETVPFAIKPTIKLIGGVHDFTLSPKVSLTRMGGKVSRGYSKIPRPKDIMNFFTRGGERSTIGPKPNYVTNSIETISPQYDYINPTSFRVKMTPTEQGRVFDYKISPAGRTALTRQLPTPLVQNAPSTSSIPGYVKLTGKGVQVKEAPQKIVDLGKLRIRKQTPTTTYFEAKGTRQNYLDTSRLKVRGIISDNKNMLLEITQGNKPSFYYSSRIEPPRTSQVLKGGTSFTSKGRLSSYSSPVEAVNEAGMKLNLKLGKDVVGTLRNIRGRSGSEIGQEIGRSSRLDYANTVKTLKSGKVGGRTKTNFAFKTEGTKEGPPIKLKPSSSSEFLNKLRALQSPTMEVFGKSKVKLPKPKIFDMTRLRGSKLLRAFNLKVNVPSKPAGSPVATAETVNEPSTVNVPIQNVIKGVSDAFSKRSSAKAAAKSAISSAQYPSYSAYVESIPGQRGPRAVPLTSSSASFASVSFGGNIIPPVVSPVSVNLIGSGSRVVPSSVQRSNARTGQRVGQSPAQNVGQIPNTNIGLITGSAIRPVEKQVQRTIPSESTKLKMAPVPPTPVVPLRTAFEFPAVSFFFSRPSGGKGRGGLGGGGRSGRRGKRSSPLSFGGGSPQYKPSLFAELEGIRGSLSPKEKAGFFGNPLNVRPLPVFSPKSSGKKSKKGNGKASKKSIIPILNL